MRIVWDVKNIFQKKILNLGSRAQYLTIKKISIYIRGPSGFNYMPLIVFKMPVETLSCNPKRKQPVLFRKDQFCFVINLILIISVNWATKTTTQRATNFKFPQKISVLVVRTTFSVWQSYPSEKSTTRAPLHPGSRWAGPCTLVTTGGQSLGFSHREVTMNSLEIS